MGNLPILPFVVAVPAYLLIGMSIFEIVRRSDLGGSRKLLWVLAVVVLPVVGTFIYLLARPFVDPTHVTQRGNQRTHAIVSLVDRHEAGSLADDSFAEPKRGILAEAIVAHRDTRI
jgi:hypothetical protein